MRIDLGGAIVLLLVALIVVAIIVIKNKRKGKDFSLPSLSLRKQPLDSNYSSCLNVYRDRIALENMLKRDGCKNARVWQVSSKTCLLQGFIARKYQPVFLPDDIAFPPERLARMVGCEPLKKLKSLKFSWLEQLAPFAPVVALGIATLLFIIVLG